MEVPQEIDKDLIQQAFAYVLRHFPQTVRQQDRSFEGPLDPPGVAVRAREETAERRARPRSKGEPFFGA